MYYKPSDEMWTTSSSGNLGKLLRDVIIYKTINRLKIKKSICLVLMTTFKAKL